MPSLRIDVDIDLTKLVVKRGLEKTAVALAEIVQFW